ncbi:hypothetical protein JAAARDRAFT_40502 [Jaapia argillacea MUCL 33604]|uniref:Uncharacterized protein n=1 Tax=Jaapia argillacea MUCL 33604 TaxID=933084 RepID=A0A067PPA2_9AGAM|nr:hypothetical protein JAAARDRAFT_40502 [Jaapia argillacea MUCL 33604]
MSTTKTHPATPVSRFSRFGLPFGHKAQNLQNPNGRDTDVDYIPYNGPYERPPEVHTKPKDRDSWGDPLDGQNGEDDVLMSDQELFQRYGGDDKKYGSVGEDVVEIGRGRLGVGRNRALSGASEMTVSSGILDPSRKSLGATSARSLARPATRVSTRPFPVPSFVTLDAAGGVGEVPMPSQRGQRLGPSTVSTKDERSSRRGSFASFFTFGQGSKRFSAAISGPSRAGEEPHRQLRQSSSTDRLQPRRKASVKQRDRANTVASRTGEDDYFNSYYSTLLPTPPATVSERSRAPTRPRVDTDNLLPSTSQLSKRKPKKPSNSPTNTAHPPPDHSPQSLRHPYAYSSADEDVLQPHKGPRSAPPVGPSPLPYSPPQRQPRSRFKFGNLTPPTIRLTAPNNPSTLGIISIGHGKDEGLDVPAHLRPSPRASILQASISTPNLRSVARGENQQQLQQPQQQSRSTPRRAPSPLKGKERWLSAETWCDALLFPRPRFKIKQPSPDGGSPSDASDTGVGTTSKLWGKRIVSPPGSPVWPSPPAQKTSFEVGTVVGSGGGVGVGSPIQQEEMVSRFSEDGPGPSSSAPRRIVHKSRSAADLITNSVARWSPPLSSQSGDSWVHVKSDDADFGVGVGGGSAVGHGQNTVNGRDGAAGGNRDNFVKSKPPRPPRPKSFAQDDLALPSPVPSLARVLEDGELLNRERQAWQSQAKQSFQNKRTRSLSRTRAKAVASSQHHQQQRARKDALGGDAAATGGKMSEKLDFLAARTFLGSQGMPPKVHVVTSAPTSDHTMSCTGIGTFTTSFTQTHTHTHSHSHTNSQSLTLSQSTSHRRGHSRNESWGQSAIKAAKSTAVTAVALCGLHDSPSPIEEKLQEVHDPLNRGRILHGEDHGRATQERHKDSGGILEFSPPSISGRALSPASAALAMMTRSAPSPGGLQGVSPTPSGRTGEGVGIAISSPPPSEGHQHDFELPIRITHPYATSTSQQTPSEYIRPAPIKSAYAGPHPISPPQILVSGHKVNISDVSIRHRLPPQVTLQHPYHYALSEVPDSPIQLTRQGSGSSSTRIFAQVPSGYVREVVTDEILYSPVVNEAIIVSEPEDYPAPLFVQASRSRSGSDAIGMGDVLSYSLGRDSGLGTSEGHGYVPFQSTDDRGEIGRHPFSRDEGMQTDDRLSPSRFRRKPALSDVLERPSFYHDHTQSSDPVSNHTFASSPLEIIDSPTMHEHAAATEDPSSSSQDLVSQQSSPQLSPQPIRNTEDLERFRDLFYRPSSKDASRTPSSEHMQKSPSTRAPSENFSVDLARSHRRGESGFLSLTRQLSEELEALRTEMEASDAGTVEAPLSDIMWGSRYGGLRGERPQDHTSDMMPSSSQHSILSSARSLHTTTLPLRLPSERGNMSTLAPSLNIPEDVESSRASSILEGSLLDEETIKMFRLGTVEAVLTPPAVSGERPLSGHLSLIDGDSGHSLGMHPISHDPHSSHRIVSQASLGPPRSADLARSSYMTSDTGGSRMSGLSDFPAPPVLLPTPAHISTLQSYFGDTPRDHIEDPFPVDTRPRRHNPEYRTTFGGDEEIELYLPEDDS